MRAKFRSRQTYASLFAWVLVTGVSLASASPATAATPNTSITSGPSELTTSRSATFKFNSNNRRATFQCTLDASAWTSCESPKRYKRLAQGSHTFQVRARKGRAKDATPAVRSFTVDSVKPETTIDSGPTGWVGPNRVTADHSPGFTFSSTEAGSFECRLGTLEFAPCTSPFTPASPLPDGPYTFEVRARDEAGNADATPATQAFSIVTPITESLETAQTAADLYFPDRVKLDVPASCDSNPTIDCPGGVPLEPSDQLSVDSIRNVVAAPDHRYDITVTSRVATLEGFTMNHSGIDCNVSLTSANGTSLDWGIGTQLNFFFDTTWGDRRIAAGTPSVSGVEGADYSISGAFLCQSGFITPAVIQGVYSATLDAYLQQVGNPLCADPGPAYLGGPCQQ